MSAAGIKRPKGPTAGERIADAERELRNIYAGLALPGLIARIPADGYDISTKFENVADKAFDLANAMIIRSRT
jgi:hypothetical protein